MQADKTENTVPVLLRVGHLWATQIKCSINCCLQASIVTSNPHEIQAFYGHLTNFRLPAQLLKFYLTVTTDWQLVLDTAHNQYREKNSERVSHITSSTQTYSELWMCQNNSFTFCNSAFAADVRPTLTQWGVSSSRFFFAPILSPSSPQPSLSLCFQSLSLPMYVNWCNCIFLYNL